MNRIRFTYESPSDTVELQRKGLFGIWRVVYSMPYEVFKALFDQATLIRAVYHDDGGDDK